MDWLNKMGEGHCTKEFRSQFTCTKIWTKNPQNTGHWNFIGIDGQPWEDGIYKFKWDDGDVMDTYIVFDSDDLCGYEYAFENKSIVAWQKLE
jgi:hypothetical protein